MVLFKIAILYLACYTSVCILYPYTWRKPRRSLYVNQPEPRARWPDDYISWNLTKLIGEKL